MWRGECREGYANTEDQAEVSFFVRVCVLENKCSLGGTSTCHSPKIRPNMYTNSKRISRTRDLDLSSVFGCHSGQ